MKQLAVEAVGHLYFLLSFKMSINSSPSFIIAMFNPLEP